MSLTQVRELDWIVLMDLDDPTLAQACQSNRWIHQICSDDFFWRERLRRKFGDEIMALKKPEESYRQMYVRLAQLQYTKDQVRTSAREGHLDEILLLREAGVPLSLYDLLEAVDGGHLDIIKWALDNVDERPELVMMVVVRRNQLELAQWLNEHYTGLITPRVIANAFRGGGPELLNWLIQLGHVPGVENMRSAFAAQNIEAIDWLIQRGIWPTDPHYMDALAFVRIGSLDHMYQQYGQLPDLSQAVINEVAHFHASLKSLIWLEQHGYPYPNIQAVREITRIIRERQAALKVEQDESVRDHIRGYIQSLQLILDWLSERGVRENAWTRFTNYLGL